MITSIKNNNMDEVLAADVALIDFSATWCGPCQMLAPVIDELAEEMGDKLQFFSIDVDNNSKLAEQYNIMSVPSVLILKKGEKVAQTVGFQGKDAMRTFIEAQL